MDLIQTDDAARARPFYFAAWRWHFYAGLYVALFLIMLAITGLVMLYLSAFVGLNGARMGVDPAGSIQPVSSLAAVAAATAPDGRAHPTATHCWRCRRARC